MTISQMNESRVIVMAPRGRDAAVIEQVLARSGTSTTTADDPLVLLEALRVAAGAAIVTEEAISDETFGALFDWLDRQPPWSDFPLIVLVTKRIGKRPGGAAALVERLGNVVMLERPIHAETLTSAVTAALRARGRQYQARGHLLEREQAQERLRLANETLERRVEERTREVEAARETLSFALESAEMGSWDLDLVHDTSRRSPRHDRIFGYEGPLPSWGQDRFLDHILDDDRPSVREAFASAVRNGSLDVECRIRRPDAAVRWIAVKGRVEYDPHGLPVRMAGIVLDRTEQRVTEDSLRQAQKMEAIGQLTGGVAHDFNNLLTVIVGGLDMIIRRPEPVARVRRLAEAAMTAARRGEQLTQQLLAFSRRQMLRPQTLNPNRLLLDFKPLADRAAGGAVELRFDLDPGLNPIRIDPAQFEAAVLNLIVNARDAMDTGPGAASSRSGAATSVSMPPRSPTGTSRLALTSRSRSRTMDRVSRPRCSSGFSSRSSRPRMSAKAPASGSARSTASRAAPTVLPPSSPRSDRERRSGCCSPVPSIPPQKRPERRRAARFRYAAPSRARRCSSSRTTSRC